MITEPLTILLETSDYIVVDKAHDLCINGEKEIRSHGKTLASVLSHLRPELVDNKVCSGFRFPHQLDYATSGALCITLNKKTTKEAVNLFREHEVFKEYLAVVRMPEVCSLGGEVGVNQLHLWKFLTCCNTTIQYYREGIQNMPYGQNPKASIQ